MQLVTDASWKRKGPILVACVLALTASFECFAGTGPGDLFNLSIEDLMNMQVTSVSKKPQSLQEIGAAVFVLGSEDIRRSGLTNIPDLLRLVPGVIVAQIDGHTWAITIRGFNAKFTNKVLALIDGRRIYSPLTSGVDWDQQDVPVEDIDRIEVIRGPGGTIWGANAVDGVINIITRRAGAAPGGLIVAGGGSHDAARDLAQYEGGIGLDLAYRLFASYSDTIGLPSPNSSPSANSWHMGHLGLRSDWVISPRDSLTVQGDLALMESDSVETLLPGERTSSAAGNILGRWTRTLADGSDFALQVYFDHYDRTIGSSFHELRNTVDLDFHHHLKLGSRHDLIWGVGYRGTGDQTSGTAFSFSPPNQTVNYASVFVQDELKLSHSLSLTIGTTLEHNTYNGFQFEPSAQLVWRPNSRQQVWASIARALRDPVRADTGAQIDLGALPLPGGGSGILELFGVPVQKSEELREAELGYRADVGHNFTLDIATFFGLWRNLTQVVPGQPYLTDGQTPLIIVPLYYENLARGNSYGGEVFATWKVVSYWQLMPGFSFSHYNVDNHGDGNLGTGNSGYTTPRTLTQIRSRIDLPRRIEWDSTFGYTGALRDFGAGAVPGYTHLDTRLGRRFGQRVEVSITGQNLLTPRHAQFPDDSSTAQALVVRSIFAKVTWRF